MPKQLYRVLLIVFSAVFLISSGFVVNAVIQSKKQQKQFDELSNMVEQAQQGLIPTPPITNNKPNDSNDTTTGETTETTETTDGTPSPEPTGPPSITGPVLQAPTHMIVKNPVTGQNVTVLREYAMIYAMNPDLVGWIKIDGTKINYPVMQTPDRPNYYLDRDFYGKNSVYGCIYAAEAADINAPSDNITIYGHKMKDGSMFAALQDYKKKKFYESHPYITFDTLNEHHTYQIISVFKISTTVNYNFPYHTFVDGNETSFATFVKKCKDLSLYDTGIDAVYGDKLITLSTCDHTIRDGRLVVVAKRIS